MSKTNLILTISLGVLIVLYGCGVKTVEIEHCIPKVTIQSTSDVIFYFIEASDYKYYASLENPPISNNYLCFYDKTDFSKDECDAYEKLGYVKTYNLPTGTKIVLDGFATKTVNWGLETIDAGPSPTTWFRGEVNGKIIWITSHDLMWMFQSESNFKSVNQQTFEALKFQQRMPQPFKRNPDGSAEHVSWLRHYESEQKNIAEWNCELK